MTVHTGTNPVTLARLAADVKQLTEPIYMAHRGKIVPHDPLLSQLRAALVPAGSIPGEHRRTVPTSRPAARLDPADMLNVIQYEITEWKGRLHLPSPRQFRHGCPHASCQRVLLERGARGPVCSAAGLERADWHKELLRSFVGAAPTIASGMAEWLGADVQGWWHDAAVGSGWRPQDLLKLR